MTPGTDPRFAYVLMSHLDPQAVLATARRIRELSPHAHVLVRHSGARGFAALGPAPAPGVEVFSSTTLLRWGTFSVVTGVVEALEEARARWHPSHTVVVSGQDRPVHDLAAWEAGVAASGADALLRADPLAYPDRWARCWHPLSEPPALLGAALRATGRAGLGRTLHHAGGRTWFFVHQRTALRPPLPYRKGSLWTTLSAAAVGELSRAVRDGELVAWFSSQLLPDESFAHSVLGAAPGLHVVDAATTTAFFAPHSLAHPRALTAADVATVLQRPAPFARKVVPGVSDDFLAAVDAAVDAERARPLQRG